MDEVLLHDRPSSSAGLEKKDLEGQQTKDKQHLNGIGNNSVGLSNKAVLGIICSLFALFVVAEIIGALASNSLSLLGDAAAMSVDVFTYLTNMYAEGVKAQGNEISHSTRMLHEVYIPAFSVAALIGIAIYITVEALDVIVNGSSENVDDAFLFGFSAGNLVIDIISSALFYSKGREILITRVHVFKSITGDEETEQSRANLNMLSALTHVGGDTLRTLSVFVAATVSTVSSTSSVQCDAWAAVVVSVTIIIGVVPLVFAIHKAAK
ncbi:hypothetical protein B484DRAFT_452074 [Ochromonadaceae sp. CCMP2298]|nr:hypothetical protein B484DRAFT_452074 [Ochromonadaceae sp. CCMP2298]|mmetsp:Transcript_30020/g.64654  ORF Transcript_30020/g.64654 Transcript_30020/m.64654 type:complete len:266 (+) Transcript_30020:148-945(+)